MINRIDGRAEDSLCYGNGFGEWLWDISCLFYWGLWILFFAWFVLGRMCFPIVVGGLYRGFKFGYETELIEEEVFGARFVVGSGSLSMRRIECLIGWDGGLSDI